MLEMSDEAMNHCGALHFVSGDRRFLGKEIRGTRFGHAALKTDGKH